MKKLLFCLFITMSVNAGVSQLYKSSEGEVSFFSEAPLENIAAHNRNVSSLINKDTKEIVFVIPIKGFKFAKAKMQEHFNEKYLESDKYPDATFKGKINENVDFTKVGDYKVTSSGTMTIHGVAKQVTHSGILTVKENELVLKSEFNVALKDYNIAIPNIVIKNIAEVVAVKLNVKYFANKPN